MQQSIQYCTTVTTYIILIICMYTGMSQLLIILMRALTVLRTSCFYDTNFQFSITVHFLPQIMILYKINRSFFGSKHFCSYLILIHKWKYLIIFYMKLFDSFFTRSILTIFFRESLHVRLAVRMNMRKNHVKHRTVL